MRKVNEEKFFAHYDGLVAKLTAIKTQADAQVEKLIFNGNSVPEEIKAKIRSVLVDEYSNDILKEIEVFDKFIDEVVLVDEAKLDLETAE